MKFSRSMKCLIYDSVHRQALWFLLARRCFFSRIIGRKDCDIRSLIEVGRRKDMVQQKRQFSDKTFNINDIIKANAKHKPAGKSIGTSTNKQLKKTTTKPKKTPGEVVNKTGKAKTKEIEAENEKESNVETKSVRKGKGKTADILETEKRKAGSEVKDDELSPVPVILKSVLETPLIVNSDLDVDRLAEFKEFVEDLELKYLPSVSRIISATQSPEQVKVLERWQARMTKELGGEAQFKEYKQGILDNGLNLHECIYNQLSGDPDATPLREGNKGHWESIAKVLPEVSEVMLMEKDCIHPELFYKGKFDCIAKYRGTLCLIEWKTSSKPKPLLSDTYDNPLQIAAYLGAVNRSRVLKKQGVDQLTSGAIVIAYNDGEQATVHAMNKKQCERYWKLWTKRLYAYWLAQYDKKKEAAEGFG